MKKNKFKENLERISKESLVEYYYSHSRKDTADFFNITERQLINLLAYYDIKKPKSLVKRTSTGRTHESYISAGKKSAETQKKHWEEKSEEEKNAWALLQKKAHSTEHFKTLIKQINIDYNASLSTEQKLEKNKARSNSCKNWWLNNFTEDERKAWIKTSLANGAGWNHKKIKGSDSKPNLSFKQLLIDNNLYESDSKNREFTLDNYSYDFKLNNILIEINPTATHNSTWSPFDKNSNGLSKQYHFNKSEVATSNNYRCIHIWDWDDINKIINLLLPVNTIYGRTCIIKDVSIEDAKLFINKYHIQGYIKDEIRIGLYYHDELVSIMTFGKPRYTNKYQYELLRYCSSNKILGGAEKLFKYFLTTFNPKTIISYCDLSKFTGYTYKKLGFSLKRISIGKHWYNIKTGQHITDNLLRQRGFDQLFNTDYGKGSSNTQLMLEHGFVEIYDAGQATYIYKSSE